MDTNPKAQTVELIKRAKDILLVTRQAPDGDSLGAMTALSVVLKKIEKNVVMAIGGKIPSQFGFLPGIGEIENNLKVTKDFVINLNTAMVEIDRLGYKQLPEKKTLAIVITPKKGEFRASDVSFSASGQRFDLVIVLDSQNLENLGALYDSNSDVFFETATVNIDHRTNNESFAKINWVDLTATSTCEMLVGLIESLAGSLNKTLFDEQTATALLTGIMSDTNSFQNFSTTPKSLTVAAQLIALGAHKEVIVLNLYKNKPLNILRLWGKILSELREEENFIWAIIREKDFEETETQSSQLNELIDDLLKTASGCDFVVLLAEEGERIQVSLRSIAKNFDSARLAALFGGGGSPEKAAFELNIRTNFEEETARIIERIKDHIGGVK